MKIEYQIFKDKNLKIHRFIGKFSFEHYGAYMQKITKQPDWKYVKRVITDIRGGIFNIDYNQIKQLVDFREKIIKKSYKNVFIVNDPSSTALTHLYQEDLLKREFDYQYCSTVEHAIELLNLEQYSTDIEYAIENLENRF